MKHKVILTIAKKWREVEYRDEIFFEVAILVQKKKSFYKKIKQFLLNFQSNKTFKLTTNSNLTTHLKKYQFHTRLLFKNSFKI